MIDLKAFDDAVKAELAGVSAVPYNSHEICEWFSVNLRNRLAALAASPVPAELPHEHGGNTSLAVGNLMFALEAWKATSPRTAPPAWAALVRACSELVAAASPVPAGWLQIETAPKERGARFIGLTATGRAVTAEPMYCVYDGPAEFRGWHEVERGAVIPVDLKGWMPLPAAPSAPAQPATEQRAVPARPAAPWPDFLGQTIRQGDQIVHPNGDEGTVLFWRHELIPGDQWRVVYGDGTISWLRLQIGDRGSAVLATPPQEPQAPAPAPAVEAQADDMRERFEAYMSSNGTWAYAIERDSRGEYKLAQTASAWNVWQAALKEPQR